MPLRDFQDEGYLLELNRRFMHPLGLSIILVNDRELRVIDHRDVYNLRFASFDRRDAEKHLRIEQELAHRLPKRHKALGYTVQELVLDTKREVSCLL